MIEARDRHCQAECGCDEPIDRCDVDHTTPVADGGITGLDSLKAWREQAKLIEAPYQVA